jgi:hypothetical protein
MAKNKRIIATIAAVGMIALVAVASCVPSVDPSEYADGPASGLTGPGIAVTILPAGSSGGPSPSLTAPQIDASTNYYELAVRKVNAPAGAWEYRRTAARRGGTLAVAVDPGYQYDVLVLGGYMPADGKNPILLRSAFATTNPVGNTAYPLTVTMTDVDIDASLYEVTLKSSVPGSPAASDAKKPFRAGGGAGVMELDLPKWETPPKPGIDHWLSDGTVKVTIRGVAPLIQAYNAAQNIATPNPKQLGATGVPAYNSTGTGFFDPASSFLPHLSLTPFMQGETHNLYPLHTPWNFDLPAQTLISTVDGQIPLQWDKIEAHSDDVWTPYDTDGKLYWDAYYYAFSNNDAALKFDQWKIQSGLDNSIDTLDGSAGNTGGAVYVKIGAGGGAVFGESGKLVVGLTKLVPKTWNLIPSGSADLTTSTFNAVAVRKIIYGGKRFVAVGAKNTASWSDDGIKWTNGTGTLGTTNGALAYDGNGRFLAGGAGGILAWSDGGQTWTPFGTGDNGGIGTNTVNAIAYGGGKFVAVSTGSKAASSPDGSASSWTAGTGSFASFNAVAYGDGRFIAVADGNNIRYSTNGVNWVGGVNTPGYGATPFNDIAYGNGRFVAVAETSGIGWTANGGVNWNGLGCNIGHIRKVIYGKGKFIAAGVSGIAWSYDGAAWTRVSTAYVTAVAYGANCYVAGTTTGAILYSGDGKTWTTIAVGAAGNPFAAADSISSIIYADDKWVMGTSTGKMAWCVPE